MDSPLIYQLEKSKIGFENPAFNIKIWKNTLKIQLILDAIENMKSEHILILDGLDVVLTPKINEIVERFKSYNKSILFGATKNNFPNKIVDKVPMRDWFGQFKYLNAGTCLGKKSKIKEFYSLCADISSKINNPTDSEQLVVRTVFDSCQDWVGFDYNCECFQTFNRIEIDVADDENSWVIK